MIATLIILALAPAVFSAGLVGFAWRRGVEMEDRLQKEERQNARD